MSKIRATKENYIKICEKIVLKGDKVNFNDLNTIEKIISKDNTEPLFVLTYLKLINEFKNDKYSEEIIKYLDFLPKELIKEHFLIIIILKYLHLIYL